MKKNDNKMRKISKNFEITTNHVNAGFVQIVKLEYKQALNCTSKFFIIEMDIRIYRWPQGEIMQNHCNTYINIYQSNSNACENRNFFLSHFLSCQNYTRSLNEYERFQSFCSIWYTILFFDCFGFCFYIDIHRLPVQCFHVFCFILTVNVCLASIACDKRKLKLISFILFGHSTPGVLRQYAYNRQKCGGIHSWTPLISWRASFLFIKILSIRRVFWALEWNDNYLTIHIFGENLASARI